MRQFGHLLLVADRGLDPRQKPKKGDIALPVVDPATENKLTPTEDLASFALKPKRPLRGDRRGGGLNSAGEDN